MRPDYALSLLSPCLVFQRGERQTPQPDTQGALLPAPARSQSSFLSTPLQAGPLSVPNATSSVPATTIPCLHHGSCLLTRFSAPLLLLPPQIHFLSYNRTELSSTLSRPATPLFTALQWLPSLWGTSARQIMICPRLPSLSCPCSSPTPDTQISVSAFPMLLLGLCMQFLFFRGKHPFCPHSFAWLTTSHLSEFPFLQEGFLIATLTPSLVQCPSSQLP